MTLFRTALALAVGLSALISTSSHAATSSVAAVSSATTFNVASSTLGGIAGCNMVAGSHSYGTSTFTTTLATTYSFTVTAVSDSSLDDPFLAVYQGSFDPLNPTVNLVGCNDDAIGLFSSFSSSLNASTTYVMVATTYGTSPANGNVTFSTGIVPSLTFANRSVSLSATGQTMTATSPSTGLITYTTSTPGVATIDATTGALTLVSAGTASITATQAAEAAPGLYNAGVATATLTVTAAVAAVAPVPTLSQWGVIFLSSLMAMAALVSFRKKQS